MTSLLVALALVPLVCTGCVRRRLTVRSEPPALAYIDDQEIGTTPVSTSYTYYGTRKIRLVRDGYETLTVLERFRPPLVRAAAVGLCIGEPLAGATEG